MQINSIECADGEMGVSLNAVNAYMKQKHRMIWERRHGPVGTGMKGAKKA